MITWGKLRRSKPLIQFAEYMVGGGIYFWCGMGIFAIFYSGLHWHWLPAKALADGVGWTLNYLIQRYWAFYDKSLARHEGRTRVRYIIINTADFMIDYAIIAGLQSVGVIPYIGFFVSAAFTTVLDYLWYKFWVFKPDTK